MRTDKLAPSITLIEILLGLMLSLIAIALYFALFGKQVTKTREIPEINKIQRDILEINNALKLYKLDNGFFPTTGQGLQALVIKPIRPPVPGFWSQYLKKVPLDPWGRPYQYFKTDNFYRLNVKKSGPDQVLINVFLNL